MVQYPNYKPFPLYHHLIFFVQERKRLAVEEKKAKKLAKKQQKKEESKSKGEREMKVQDECKEAEKLGVKTEDCAAKEEVILVCKSDAVELTPEDHVDDIAEQPLLLFTKTFDEV